MTPTIKPEEDPSWFHAFLTAGKRTCAYEKRFALWTIVWALSLAATMFLLRGEIVATPYAWVVALVPLFMAIFPLLAYYRFIMRADELIRKIQLDSVCIGFIIGLLYSFTRITLEEAGLQPADAGDVGTVMMFAWGFGQIYSTWRYR